VPGPDGGLGNKGGDRGHPSEGLAPSMSIRASRSSGGALLSSLAIPSLSPRRSGRCPGTSLEIYSRLALADAQHTYDSVIDQFPV
jgi:hypothetical protein